VHNIWKIKKHPILALAPMAGYTDPAFRIMCLKNGADIVYTEMISVEAIWRKNERTMNMLKLLPKEKNVILQLFGNKPESFAKALKIINTKSFSGIDINFGCPARKVTKTGSGSALMNNKKLAREIIQTVLNNTDLPVSIKIRSQVKNTTAIEFIEFIKDLQISAIMIHGRSLKQLFSGPIDFEIIKEVKQLLPNIPVLANGGINNSKDAQEMLNKTGADGLGIARGAWGKPWIFKLNNKEQDWKFIKKQILQHAEFFLQQQKMCGYKQNLEPLRKHLIHYIRGQKNASELRQKIIKVKSLEELKKI